MRFLTSLALAALLALTFSPGIASGAEILPRLLHEPVPTTVVELATDALPIWREHAADKPTLVLLSNEPFLMPIPDKAKEKGLELARIGSPEEMVAHGRYYRAAPQLLPSQAVRSAIASDFFSRIVWVMPVRGEEASINPDKLKQTLVESGIMSTAEAATIKSMENRTTGRMGDTPILFTLLKDLPELAGPILLHVDLSFFAPLYKNEVSTPIYLILMQTMSTLREAKWGTRAATVSMSTEEEGMVPLDSRFVGYALEELLANPERMQNNLPRTWDLRGRSYYLRSMFNRDLAREQVEKMIAAAPDKADVQFDMYMMLRGYQEVDKAMEHLDKAVDIDPGYAFEYLRLAGTAINKNRPDAALRMLAKGSGHYPDDPFLKLRMVEIQLELGETHASRKLLQQLQGLEWSPVYYPNIPGYLEELKKKLDSISTAGKN